MICRLTRVGWWEISGCRRIEAGLRSYRARGAFDITAKIGGDNGRDYDDGVRWSSVGRAAGALGWSVSE
jgi:hypothetical protein